MLRKEHKLREEFFMKKICFLGILLMFLLSVTVLAQQNLEIPGNRCQLLIYTDSSGEQKMLQDNVETIWVLINANGMGLQINFKDGSSPLFFMFRSPEERQNGMFFHEVSQGDLKNQTIIDDGFTGTIITGNRLFVTITKGSTTCLRLMTHE
jgi:hypothetical protein